MNSPTFIGHSKHINYNSIVIDGERTYVDVDIPEKMRPWLNDITLYYSVGPGLDPEVYLGTNPIHAADYAKVVYIVKCASMVVSTNMFYDVGNGTFRLDLVKHMDADSPLSTDHICDLIEARLDKRLEDISTPIPRIPVEEYLKGRQI